MRQLCTLQHDSFVLLGTVAVMNMHADNLSRGAQAVTRPQPSSQQAGNLEVLLPLQHVQGVLFLLRTGERPGLERHFWVWQALHHPRGKVPNPAFGKGHAGLPSKIGLFCSA